MTKGRGERWMNRGNGKRNGKKREMEREIRWMEKAKEERQIREKKVRERLGKKREILSQNISHRPVWVLGYPEDVKCNHWLSMYMLLIC